MRSNIRDWSGTISKGIRRIPSSVTGRLPGIGEKQTMCVILLVSEPGKAARDGSKKDVVVTDDFSSLIHRPSARKLPDRL